MPPTRPPESGWAGWFPQEGALRLLSFDAVIVLLGAVVMSSCFQPGDAYPPPPQRLAAVQEKFDVGAYTDANAYGARAYFLRDVGEQVEAASWRWTYARPQFRFRPQELLSARTGSQPGARPKATLDFVLNFAVPDVVIQKTGPLTLTVSINDRVLARPVYDSSGVKQFRQPVPDEWLGQGEVIVDAYFDKQLVAEGDGRPLGYILLGVGFQP